MLQWKSKQEEAKHGGSEEGFWGVTGSGGDNGKISTKNIPTATVTYLNTNGNSGYNNAENWTHTKCAIGGNSVINNGSLLSGLGKNRGTGGDQHGLDHNGIASECTHDAKSENGVGGCLYILPTNLYCIVNIKVPDNSYNVKITVTNDDVSGEYVDDNVLKVGTIENNGNISFIVKRGAIVNYTVSKEYYNTENGSFIVGQTKIAHNLNVGAINNSNNEQTANIKLSKTILTHTITSNGANIKVSGKFMQSASSDGTVVKNSETGTGTVTVYVWQGEPNIKIESVSKSYYNTLTNYEITAGSTKTDSRNLTDGSATISTNNTTTTVTLPKTKYYSDIQQYYVYNTKSNFLQADAEWQNRGNLKNNNAILALKRKNEYGTITLTFNGDTNNTDNWKLYIKNYKVGIDANNSTMTVTVKDNSGATLVDETLKFNEKDKEYTKEYSWSSKNIKTVIIKFSTSSGTNKRFWLSQVYVETTN